MGACNQADKKKTGRVNTFYFRQFSIFPSFETCQQEKTPKFFKNLFYGNKS